MTKGVYANKASEQSAKWHQKRRADQRQALVGERTCLICGDPVPYRRVKSYCSTRCRQRAYMGFTGPSLSERYGITATTVGAAHELLVAADLMKHGFDVFRSMSPNADCDLAILDGHTLYRVEVKTGYRARTGHLYHTPPRHRRFDLLAIVEDNGQITYRTMRDDMSLPINMTPIEEKRPKLLRGAP